MGQHAKDNFQKSCSDKIRNAEQCSKDAAPKLKKALKIIEDFKTDKKLYWKKDETEGDVDELIRVVKEAKNSLDQELNKMNLGDPGEVNANFKVLERAYTKCVETIPLELEEETNCWYFKVGDQNIKCTRITPILMEGKMEYQSHVLTIHNRDLSQR